MILQWITDEPPRFLGALSAAENLQAKSLLASWNSTDGNHCVLKYGSQAPDIDSNWNPRDDEVLGCFSKWWNDAGKSPKLPFSSKGAFGEPPKSSADLTQAHLDVLKSWAASSPAFRFHAKSVLAMWNKAQNQVFAGYPEPSDLTNLGWGWRDGQMLGNFVLWWNLAANPPIANWGQQALPSPSFSGGFQQSPLTAEHAAALNTWAQKTGAGLPTCIESCLIDTGGVTPLSATPAQIAECVGQCSGAAPTPPCPAGFAWDGQKCVSLLPPGQPPSTPPGCGTGGQIWNPVKQICECATGQVWSAAKQACVPGIPVLPPGPVTPAKAAAKSNAGVVLAVLAGVGIAGAIVNALIKVPAPPAMQGNPKRRRARRNPTLGDIDIANPCDENWTRELYYFSLGAYGSTHVYVWANSADDAMEEMVEWVDDNAPGLLSTIGEEDLREAAEDLGIEYDPEDIDYRIIERAEADMYVVGHTTLKHGNAMPSWEIHFDEITGSKKDAVRRLSKILCEDEGSLPLPNS